MTTRLQDLFVLNERVAFFGRRCYDFFGMVPVGAINIGSIKVNSDSVSIAPNTSSRNNRGDLLFLPS